MNQDYEDILLNAIEKGDTTYEIVTKCLLSYFSNDFLEEFVKSDFAELIGETTELHMHEENV